MDKILFSLAVVLIPFDGLKLLPGAASIGLFNMGYFYPMSIGIVLLILKRHLVIRFDKKIILGLVLFIVLGCVGICYHFFDIVAANSFNTTGLSKAFSAIFMFAFILVLNTYIYSMLIKIGISHIIDFICKYITYGYYIVLAFAVIQLGTYSGIDLFRSIWELIGPFINIQHDIGRQFSRVYSVCQEPSTFCTYMAFVFPWLFFVAYKNPTYKNLFLVLSGLLLTFLSQSRLGYVVVSLEFVLLLLFISSSIKKRRLAMYIGIVLIFFTAVLIFYYDEISNFINTFLAVFQTLDFYNEGRSTSNYTRYGTQIAGLKMFLDYPILGVGPGQSMFYMEEYLPPWAWLSPEIQGIVQNAAMNIYNAHVKILAEYGILGVGIWAFFMVYTFVNLFKIYKREHQDYLIHQISPFILISLIGSIISMSNFATIIWFQYWLIINVVAFLKNTSMITRERLEKKLNMEKVL